MSEKKKAAPDVEAIENGTGIQTSGQAVNLPNQQYNTAGRKPQAVESFLLPGAEHAISSTALMKLCGIRNVRDLREAVANERKAGAVILSSTTGGYFLPDAGEKGREEMQHFVNTVRSKALNLLKAARPARNALRILEGQERIEYDG